MRAASRVQLSPHFSYKEFIASETAARHGISNEMPGDLITNARALCENLLEPARAELGPLRINSGYRSKLLNSLIGGAAHSQHIKGEAADVIPLAPGVSIGDLFRFFYFSDFPVDQVIFEMGAWVHVSHVLTGNPRRSALSASKVGGKTTYFTLTEAQVKAL